MNAVPFLPTILQAGALAGLDDPGIDDDDAQQAPRGITVGQPETRHGSNLRRVEWVARCGPDRLGAGWGDG
jgi:hypothetical protein